MDQNEKDALYQEFRERLLYDMGRRANRQGELLRPFGVFLLRWANEIVIARILMRTASDVKNASPGSVTVLRACGICSQHVIPLNGEWKYWLNSQPVCEVCQAGIRVI